MDTELLESLTQFGAAGLMGVLWVWERTMSQRREAMMNEAHQTLMRERRETESLLETLRHNTRALERFEATQSLLKQLLESLHETLRRREGRDD